jgi:hypothetical protein
MMYFCVAVRFLAVLSKGSIKTMPCLCRIGWPDCLPSVEEIILCSGHHGKDRLVLEQVGICQLEDD